MVRKSIDEGHKLPSSPRKVGYAQPPKDTQFKPGQSGNPAGRPKGRRNFKTELFEELNETVEITERGVKKKVTIQRALIKTLLAKAAAGHEKILTFILDKALDSTAPDQPTDAIENPNDLEIVGRHNAKILAQYERKGGPNE